MKLFLCPNAYTEAQQEEARQCARTLSAAGHSVSLSGGDGFGAEESDLIVSLGGDGSVLRAAQTAIKAGRPLIGVNSGRRGYLCALGIGELDGFDRIAASCRISERMLLELEPEGGTVYALNDVVVAKKNFGETVDLTVTVGGDSTKLRADGLIIATPTGSTAYNLSAGGPVLDPESRLTVLTPVCAHASFGHSVVLSGETGVSVSERGDSAAVYADGSFLCDLSGALRVRPSERTLALYTRYGFLRDLAGL